MTATKDLIGAALDWAVAKCEGWIKGDITHPKFCRLWRDQIRTPAAYPSTDWAHGGPIIEREGISIIFHEQGHWTASNLHGTVCGEGPTPLIAGMRCYCCSKLGDEIEVPYELIKENQP